jgi:putative oxidoreductase
MNKPLLSVPTRWALLIADKLDHLHAPAQLVARLYVANVFFLAGLTKIRDWDTTLALFNDEYMVPFLSPALAAFGGTAGELVLPVLLVLGLFGRLAAFGLFVLNFVAVISLGEVPPAALQQHLFWGSVLAFLFLWGPGNWSVDRFLAPRLRASASPPLNPDDVSTMPHRGQVGH